MRQSLATLLLGWCGLVATAAAADDLAVGFATPPNEAKPRVYWWWLNNLVNREGITRDLEQYKAKGIGGVLLFNAGMAAGPMPSGADFMSPEWRELVKHAVREADRLGLEVSINLCSGWDAGGPWITEETASHHYVQAALHLTGPRKYAGKLPQSPGNIKAYHDVVVQAFRMTRDLVPQVTASSQQSDYPATKAIDEDDQTMWVSNGWKAGDAPTAQRPEWLQLEYAQQVTASTFWIVPRSPYGPRDIEVQASTDGKTFTTIKKQTLSRDGEQAVPVPPTRSQIFRILVTSSHAAENCQIAEVGLARSRHPDRQLLAMKAGRDSVSNMGSVRAGVEAPLGPPPFDAEAAVIDPQAIMDLTDRVQADGTLAWEVPEGDWTILRTGYTVTGRPVSCSTKGGEGPEMDWLDDRAMDVHFKSMADVLLDDSAPFVGKTLKYLHDDSWEVGLPNWNRQFLAEFKKYRGYDARPYLPVLAGHMVGSAEVSDRFLHDLRKTIGDCLAVNHYARFAELAKGRGVGIHPEAGGPCWPKIVPMDALKNLGRCDIPMGEFWQDGFWKEHGQNTNGKQTATAAHVYGKRWVMAEAFTSMGPHWEEGPAELKPTADIAFCEGINRFVHHTSTSTRPEDGKPGYEYFAGTHFNPNVTWWDEAGTWTSYIARCQWLLSRGLFVADVLYYNGDWTPNLVEPKHIDPELGQGYDYDVCNAEVLLARLTVRDGRLMLPDGMSYRVLVLPDRRCMPVEILRKIKELVEAGATVSGPRPEKDPGLKDYPRCDDEIRKLAADVWGDCDGKKIKQHKLGRGRVIWGTPLREILAQCAAAPDMEFAAQNKDAFLDFIHRRDGDAEIYFVANRVNRDESVRCTFRVGGRQPELWDPVAGTMREAAAFTQTDGRTTLPLDFAPYASMFVIFRKPVATSHQGAAAGNSLRFSESVDLRGTWTVGFDPKWGGPQSARFENLCDWTKRPEAGIHYYSGTANYTTTFTIPQPTTQHPESGIYLDLGEVRNIARVRLNGKDLGVLWTRPFRVEVTGAIRPSDNLLEIAVTNLWPNRLIADASLPAEQRLTRTHVTKFNKDSPLLPSGLLGPVMLRFADPAADTDSVPEQE